MLATDVAADGVGEDGPQGLRHVVAHVGQQQMRDPGTSSAVRSPPPG